MASRLLPGILVCTIAVAASLQAAAPGTQTERILVDQFGYLPDAKKIAVLNDPQTGYNSAASYSPGATLQVRAVGTNEIVFQGAAPLGTVAPPIPRAETRCGGSIFPPSQRGGTTTSMIRRMT